MVIIFNQTALVIPPSTTDSLRALVVEIQAAKAYSKSG